jgi:antitoxin MazE
MRIKTTVSKWGNSLAVRIPRAIAKEAHLNEGDRLALDFDRDGSIVLRPVRRRYELAELVSRITPRAALAGTSASRRQHVQVESAAKIIFRRL